jgi:hypothetical protein
VVCNKKYIIIIIIKKKEEVRTSGVKQINLVEHQIVYHP